MDGGLVVATIISDLNFSAWEICIYIRDMATESYYLDVLQSRSSVDRVSF